MAPAALVLARKVAQSLSAGQVLMVGGCVRDRLLDIPIKDIDLEVYGMTLEEITSSLRDAGLNFVMVGRSFPVIKIEQTLDLALPRREVKTAQGHLGFSTEVDPHMSFEDSARRRDFTINAMGESFTGEIIDPYDGQKDLARGILKAVSPAFAEDPLRVLRGFQFAARFGMEMDSQTIQLCQDLTSEFHTLPRERIWGEWEKWALSGLCPSKGLEVLRKTGWLSFFPEVYQLQGVPQDPQWHPEGDVYKHTLHVCDAAAAIASESFLSPLDRIPLLFSALCHDFGKVTTTSKNEQGRWVSPGHASAGIDAVKSFAARIHMPEHYLEIIIPLVKEHMVHLSLASSAPSQRSVRRLASRLYPATLNQLSFLVEADSKGRPPAKGGCPLAPWLDIARNLQVENGKPEPILMGRHLIQIGLEPGPKFGSLLEKAYEAQLDGDFENESEAREWLTNCLNDRG